jgi:hypothetical protein
MPDTGLPWEIPYLDGTELVRDYPDFSEDLADAIVDGLDAAGGLVAVKHVIKTNTQVSSSVAQSANVAVDGLSITHTVAEAGNRLILMAMIGVAGNGQGQGQVGIAVADDGTLIGIADADGSRSRVASGVRVGVNSSNILGTMLHAHLVYDPDDVTPTSHTYTVRAINVSDGSNTLYINRLDGDFNEGNRQRGASALTLMEVKV